MEMKDFQYLITLADECSISRAAEKLYMAQSSLSQFLQQYENELGVKLFYRTSKGIQPTANGELYIAHLRSLLYDYKQAKKELWDNEGLKGGRVTLGISSFRGQQTLPKILSLFAERYPNVHVDVVEAHSLRLEELLLDRKLDIAVVAMPSVKLNHEALPLIKDEVYLVTGREYPMAEFAREAEGSVPWVDLQDAAKFPFILSPQDTILGTIARNQIQKRKIEPDIRYNSISAAMALSMAKAGLGVAFTYSSCVDPEEPLRLYRIGKKGVFLQLGVARPTREYHSRVTEAMEEVIREVYCAES